MADYLNMDANLVRILTVLITLFTGVPVILYIIALFIVPEDTAVRTAPPPVTGASTYPGPFSGTQSSPPPPAYAPFPGAGATETTRPSAEDAVWGSEGAPWEQRQPAATTPETAPSEPAATTPEPTAPSEPEAPVVPPEESKPEDSTKA